jgi:anti-sigma factor RsiW
MTSTADMAQHPDVSEISDLTEGLLSPDRSAEVRTHLDGCGPCADTEASLEEIRELLGATPGEARMPTDIAGRIDAALAAEALLSATAPEAAPVDFSRETSTGAGRPSAPGRPPGRARGATRPGGTKRRRRSIVLGSILGVAALGLSVFFVQEQITDADRRPHSVTAKSGGPAEEEARKMKSRVDALVAGSRPGKRGERSETFATKGTSSRSPDTPEVGGTFTTPTCVLLAAGRQGPLIGVERFTHEGVDAYLVVLSDSRDRQRIHAFAVDAGCETSSPTTPGKVLTHKTYTRG